MYLGLETVKTYRRRIISKLMVRNMTHAVGVAAREGWL